MKKSPFDPRTTKGERTALSRCEAAMITGVGRAAVGWSRRIPGVTLGPAVAHRFSHQFSLVVVVK